MITLQYHNELNPLLFDGDKLKSDVRRKLLNIADAWREYAKIPQGAVDKVICVGGNMNYNYTDQSDLDVHLLIDKSKIRIPPEILDDWLWDRKAMWGKTHNITIHGIPIELFAQDIDEKWPADQGIYDLTHDEWMITPNDLHLDFTSGKFLKIAKNANAYRKEIDDAIEDNNINKLTSLKVRFMKMRVRGLTHGGEFSLDNLIYKELRNTGALDRMNSAINIAYDRSMSESLNT